MARFGIPVAGWKRLLRKLGLALAAATLGLGSVAAAQAPPDIGAAQRESERIQREQEARRQQQILQDQQNTRAPARIEVPAPEVRSGRGGSACRRIDRIVFDGADRLGTRTQARLAAGFQGRCLNADDVGRLLGDVTKLYIDRGLSTTRAYLPEQDLSTGTLRIRVVEGRIGEIRLQGRGVNLAGAFPNARGKVLQLRELEQGIDQINRLSTNNATLDIRPGAQPGDSIVTVINQPRRRIFGTFSADNLGSISTGRNQFAITATGEDLLGLNELFSVTRRQSQPLNNGPNRSSAENVFGLVPYGPLTVSGGYAASRYRTRITTPGGLPLTLTGTSKSGFGTVDMLVSRTRTDQAHLAATLTLKNNVSFIDGQRLSVSSRKLAILDVDALVTTTRLGGFVSMDFGYSRGLGGLGALRDLPGLGTDAPRAQFDKFRFSGSYFNTVKVGGRALNVSSLLSAQLSPQTLYGSEQFAIGGAYTVRGFRETSLADDNGVSLRNEIGLPIRLQKPFKLPTLLKPYLGLDVGHVFGNATGSPRGTLVGGAAGASLSAGPAFVDFFVAKRIAAPRFLRTEGVMAFGRVSIRI